MDAFAWDTTTVLVAGALLLAAFVKGATGLGFPTIATPMVTLLLDIRLAVAILLIPNIVMDATQILRGGFPRELVRRFAWLFFTVIFGVYWGTVTLMTLPLWVLNAILGIALLVFVSTNIAALDFAVPAHLERLLSPAVGLLGGFLMGLTNVGGPAFAMYLYSLKLVKRDFIKSIAAIFIVNKLGQLVSFYYLDMMTLSTIGLSLFVLAFILIGFYLGLKTQDRVNQKTFNRGLLSLLSLMGLVLLVRAFTSS